VGYLGLARVFGVGLKTSGSVALLTTGMGLASATLLGVVVLVDHPVFHSSAFAPRIGLAIGVLAAMLIVIHPAVFWRLINLGLKVFKRTPVTVTLDFKRMFVFFMGLMAVNGLFLTGGCAVLYGLVALDYATLPLTVGAYCLANVIGFLALFAPAGIGVREGLMLLALTPVLGAGIAGLAAVLLRFIQTAVDGLVILGGLMAWYRIRPAPAEPVSPPDDARGTGL
jgi:hypothetical protein